MSAIAAAWEAAEARGHLRVLAAFAASIAVHACLLALAREWRALDVGSSRAVVVTLRAPGGDGSPGGSAGAGSAAAALAAHAPGVAVHPAPGTAVQPAPDAAATAAPVVAPPPQPMVHARIPARAPVRRAEVARVPMRDVAAAPPRRALDAAPSPANAPHADTATDGPSARAAESSLAFAAGGADAGGAGGSGTGRGRGDGDGAGLGTGDGADGLRALCASCPAPEYPARARRQGWQGTVDVALAIGPDGAVTEARVRRSSGYPPLDDVALDVARRSRFTVAAAAAVLRGELRYRFVLDATAARR